MSNLGSVFVQEREYWSEALFGVFRIGLVRPHPLYLNRSDLGVLVREGQWVVLSEDSMAIET